MAWETIGAIRALVEMGALWAAPRSVVPHNAVETETARPMSFVHMIRGFAQARAFARRNPRIAPWTLIPCVAATGIPIAMSVTPAMRA